MPHPRSLALLALAAAPLLARPAAGQLLDRGKEVPASPGGDSASGGPADVARLSQELARGRVVLAVVRFAGGSDRLAPASAAEVERLAAALRATTGVFAIEAHVPAGAGAQSLSMRRAAALQARLVAAGVDASRLLATGTVSPRPAPAARSPDDERLVISRLY